MRGRVFEFVNGEKKYWKERGMANIALQRDSCGKPRLVAKYVKTGEVCADHYSKSSMRAPLHCINASLDKQLKLESRKSHPT